MAQPKAAATANPLRVVPIVFNINMLAFLRGKRTQDDFLW